MRKTYDIDANEVLALLKEAKQRNAVVSIEGKVGTTNIKKDDVQFAIGLISSRHPRIDRSRMSGLHTVVDEDDEKEHHEISLFSDTPPYELEIKYSLSSAYYGGIFGIAGLLWDAGKAILQIRD